MWVGVLAYLINPRWMGWAAVWFPAWLRWSGAAFLLCAGALLVWTLRSLGGNLTDTVVTRKHHTLVTTGPYVRVRHPFYVSAALLVAAVSLLAANWFLFAAGALVIALLVIRTTIEERFLLARFGDQYRSYIERTGRFIPHLRRRA